MMEAIPFSETSVPTRATSLPTAEYCIPQNRNDISAADFAGQYLVLSNKEFTMLGALDSRGKALSSFATLARNTLF
jgi:hypothetical protein